MKYLLTDEVLKNCELKYYELTTDNKIINKNGITTTGTRRELIVLESILNNHNIQHSVDKNQNIVLM